GLLPSTPGGCLRLRQSGLESLLEIVDVSEIPLRVHERIRISILACLQLVVLGCQSVEGRMRTQENLDREGSSLFICRAKVVDDSGILLEGPKKLAVQAALDE